MLLVPCVPLHCMQDCYEVCHCLRPPADTSLLEKLRRELPHNVLPDIPSFYPHSKATAMDYWTKDYIADLTRRVRAFLSPARVPACVVAWAARALLQA